MQNNNVTNLKTNRFDYVAYDEKATNIQTEAKTKLLDLEAFVNEFITDGRAKALVMTKLEEVYMWIGKGIRDDQWKRTGVNDLHEQRNSA